jgi:hypothetical protein
MRRTLLLAFWLLAAPTATWAADGTTPVAPAQPTPIRAVVELFTSQGCSNCPPADTLLKTYADRKDVIALTLPVDYWDYIGWKDTLASSRNTERQRSYAKNFGIGPVYTPQVVINGSAQALGSDAQEIDRAIEASDAATAARRVPVAFWNYGDSVIIETGGAPPGVEFKDATIWLAVVQKSVAVPVKAGENSGETLTYINVVHELTPVGLWNGRPSTIRLAMTSLMRPESEDLVVLIQEANAGAIIGAARLAR